MHSKSQLGTGDAVKIALDGFKIKSEYSLILYGDTPFIKNNVKKMIAKADSFTLFSLVLMQEKKIAMENSDLGQKERSLIS